jgi:hypothetical protein
VRRAGIVLGLVAAPLAVTDLAHKALADAPLYHARPALHMAALAVVAAGWAVAVAATRSIGLAAAGGVFLGGVVGNVASVVFWPGVPNPLAAGAIAYNLADVFVAAGLALTLVAAAVVVVRDRDRLGERVELR